MSDSPPIQPFPPMPGVEIAGTVRVDAYRVIARAVEEGIMWGLQHSTKHVDNPTQAEVAMHLERDIMNELCEILRFDD